MILNHEIGEKLVQRLVYYANHPEALIAMKVALVKFQDKPAAQAVAEECVSLTTQYKVAA